MIIYRVAKGTAWSSGTAHELIAQNVARNGGFNPTVPDAERLSAMRYRVTSQMTQASTAFNFAHTTGSLNILSTSVRDSNSGSGRMTGSTPCLQACAEHVQEEDDE